MSRSESSEAEEVVYGRRPVLALLQQQRPIHRLLLARGSGGSVVEEIRRLAKSAGIPFDLRDRAALDRQAAGGAHQGVVALIAAHEYTDFATLVKQAREPLFVFLDGIQDPQNLGAIIRSAHAMAATAVIIPRRGAAGLSATAAKASAGALDRIPICRVANLRHAMDAARDCGVWITGLDPSSDRMLSEVDFRGASALVVGGEGKGLRRLVREGCDFLTRIPMRRQAGSMNASVAAGIALYEAHRQRPTPEDSAP
ncbi:MAG: 23S rRNA (guanosine(2251)-2'-O)-methyltransferase RlmB [Candidatus Latescibacterota bacterium]|nr:23S rRNA (guanosine(2251)-2'-O)-methyltransferase RlmB [Candidatus Latescibacterota bacterium]